MRVIVVGGGKVGYYLAETLMEHGHTPHVIELDREVCERLANELDLPVICGDGTTVEALEHANVRQADALIGVTGRDEDNLIACQLAKHRFNVPRTVARVNNPKNMGVMKRLGVDIPVSSTDNIARLLEREVDTAAIKQLMPINRGESSLSEVQLPKDFAHNGVRLSELKLPEESIVVSVVRDDQMIIPRGNTQLFSGDKIITICHNKVVHELSQILGLAPEEGKH